MSKGGQGWELRAGAGRTDSCGPRNGNLEEFRGNESGRHLRLCGRRMHRLDIIHRNAGFKSHTKSLSPTLGPSAVSTPAGNTFWNFTGLQKGASTSSHCPWKQTSSDRGKCGYV